MKNKSKKVTFTSTEHFGKEDINELVLRPLVDYINESFGREVVVVRDKEPEDKPEVVTKPERKPRKGKDEKPLAQ